MIMNRRKEPFRYTMKDPVDFELHILSINGNPAPTKPVPARLYDISRSGCRIWIPLALHVSTNRIAIRLDLQLNQDPLQLEGELRWGPLEKDQNYYGVEFLIPEQEQDRLPRELRMLAGDGRIVAK